MQLQSRRDQEQAPTPHGPSQEMWTPVGCQPAPFASTSLSDPAPLEGCQNLLCCNIQLPGMRMMSTSLRRKATSSEPIGTEGWVMLGIRCPSCCNLSDSTASFPSNSATCSFNCLPTTINTFHPQSFYISLALCLLMQQHTCTLSQISLSLSLSGDVDRLRDKPCSMSSSRKAKSSLPFIALATAFLSDLNLSISCMRQCNMK